MFGLASVFCFLIALLEEWGLFSTRTLWEWIIGGLLALALHATFGWWPGSPFPRPWKHQ